MLPFLFPCGNLDDEMMILLMVQNSGEKTTWDVKNLLNNGINYYINWCRISAIKSMFPVFISKK